MIKQLIQSAWLPISLLCIYLLFLVAYLNLGLPSPSEILRILEKIFDQYGLVAVFFAAVIESIFMISFYFPGSVVIVLSVLVSGGELQTLFAIGFLCWLGFSFGMILNYSLGYFGLYKALLFLGRPEIVENTKLWLEKHGTKAAFVSGFHPNFLAIVAVCFGIAKTSFFKSLIKLLLILAFWVPVAVLIALFLIRTVSVADDSQHYYVALVFLIWALIQMVIKYIEIKDSWFDLRK